jgi:hypothetical protein
VWIGWAAQASGLDTGIDRFRKSAVLDDPYRLAGKKRQPFSFPRRMNPALVHAKHQAIVGVLDDLVSVDQ